VKPNKRVGLFLLTVAVLILGTLPLILKLLVQVVDPVTLTWFRFTGSATILAVLGRRGIFDDLKSNCSRRGVALALTTSAGLTGNYVFFMMGLQYLSPSTVHIVLQVAPFLVLAGGIVFFREPLTLKLSWGVLLLAIGSALFFNQRYEEIQLGTDFVIGVGIALISAFGWATFFLTQKALHPTMRSSTILFCCCSAGGIALLPFASYASLALLDDRLLIFLLCSTVATVIGYTSISTATRTIAATTMGLALATIPLVTMFAMMVLANSIEGLTQENLNATAILGAMLVVVGLMIGTSGRKNSDPLVGTPESRGRASGLPVD